MKRGVEGGNAREEGRGGYGREKGGEEMEEKGRERPFW